MTDETGVNTQITDSVTQAHITTMDQSPVQSHALLDLVMAETVGMGMHNAINTQHSMQMMASAAITATCARMISGQESVPPPKPDTDTKDVTPTPPLAPQDPATIIAAAESEAQKAASTITKAAQMAKQTVNDAKSALTKLGAATDSSSTTDGSGSDTDKDKDSN